jgi:hypothetical protein
MSRLLSRRDLIAGKQYDCDIYKMVARDFGSFEEMLKYHGMGSTKEGLDGDDSLYQKLKTKGFVISVGDKYIRQVYIDDDGFFNVVRFHLICEYLASDFYDEG